MNNNNHQFWPANIAARDQLLFSIVKTLDKSQWWSSEKIADYQMAQLASLLEYAKLNTRHYASLLENVVDIVPERVQEILASLPLTTKQQIQADEKAFLAIAHDPAMGALSKFTTSGSVGVPLTVTWNAYANTFVRAKVFRYHQWHGSNPVKKHSSLRALSINDGEAPKTIRGKNWYPLIPGGESATQAANWTVDQQIQWLEKEKPNYLLTYPSNAFEIVRFSKENKLKLPSLERINTYGESMIADLPSMAEEVFQCKVVDKYSCREVGEIATQCPESGLYHIQSETVYLELLKENGEEAKEGEVGQIVVTNLHNSAMPIIRYAISDYAERGPQCSCGRGLPTLKRILGRQRNMFIMPNGDRIWPRFSAGTLHLVAPLSQFQLIQKTIDSVIVKIVPKEGFVGSHKDLIKTEIFKMLPKHVDLEVEVVGKIERSASGKYEDFKCEIESV